MKQSGIDIDLGNSCSKIAYDWAKKTFSNRKNKMGQLDVNLEGSFSNILYFDKIRLGIGSDGIGTKIEVAERMKKYDTLGYDLVAMVADDLVANGFQPTNLSNILDVDHLDEQIVDELMKGLHNASKEASIAVTGGEIAELGNRICGYGNKMHFNWCSTAIGYLPDELEKPIDGSEIQPGNKIIGLYSRGFRSNGFSLIRKILLDQFGDKWHEKAYSENQKWGDIALIPSDLYSPIVNKLIENDCKIHGIVHVTGGGLSDNTMRILKKKNLGALFNDIFEPHVYMKKLQTLGEVSEELAYRVWNMGTGMLIIADQEEATKICDQIKTIETRICGTITEDRKIDIYTKGCKPTKLSYNY